MFIMLRWCYDAKINFFYMYIRLNSYSTNPENVILVFTKILLAFYFTYHFPFCTCCRCFVLITVITQKGAIPKTSPWANIIWTKYQYKYNNCWRMWYWLMAAKTVLPVLLFSVINCHHVLFASDCMMCLMRWYLYLHCIWFIQIVKLEIIHTNNKFWNKIFVQM